MKNLIGRFRFTYRIQFVLLAALQIIFQFISYAESASSSGLSLLNAPNAEAVALGEALVAKTDNIAAFHYNPASLASLKQGQASFLYEKGAFENSTAHLTVGMPFNNHGFGIAVGHSKDAGQVTILRNNVTNTVEAGQDTYASLGYGHKLGQTFLGVTAKYLSSEIIGFKANAFAVDAGLQHSFSRLHLGASLRNVGAGLQYINKEEPLPRLLVVGGAFLLSQGKVGTTLFVDAPYLLNEKSARAAIGLQVKMGALALRGGYTTAEKAEKFTAGVGLGLGALSLDYALGLVQAFDTRHLLSLSMRFGQSDPTLARSSQASTASTNAIARLEMMPADIHSQPIGSEKSISLPEINK